MTPLTPLVAPAQSPSPFATAGDAVQASALTAAQQGAFAREFSRAQSLARQEAPTESAAEEAMAAATMRTLDAPGDTAGILAQNADARPVPAPIETLRELLQRVAEDSARFQAVAEVDSAAASVVASVPEPDAAPTAVQGAAANASAETTDAEDDAADRASTDGALHASDRRESARPAREAGPATPPADPNVVVRDLGALQPEFRERVERVVTRMKEEHGLDVSVAETWRGQPRQEHLYEQGRSRAGEVVTWTRRSRHTEGRAADLVVNGPASADGYRLLGHVARQEGLQTLGVRDPGHVELAAASRNGASALPGAPKVMEVGIAGAAMLPHAAVVAPVASVASVATVAPVATSATVASVATVAPVGTVVPPPPAIRSAVGARNGETRSPSSVRRSSDGPSVLREGAPTIAVEALPAVHHRTVPPGSAGAPEVSARTGRGSREERRPTPVTREAADIAVGGSSFSTRAAASAAATPNSWPVSAASVAGSPPGIDTTARVAQVIGLQDARSALPVSHLMLHLDTPDGGVDRVRVALRGTRVGATIELHDGTSAAGLSRRLPELVAALEARGLESGHLRVQPTTGHDGSTLADLVRATVGDASAARGTLFASSENQFSRSRDDEPGGHTQQESPRHRSRREQKDSTR